MRLNITSRLRTDRLRKLHCIHKYLNSDVCSDIFSRVYLQTIRLLCLAVLAYLPVISTAATTQPYVLSMLPLFSATEIRSRTQPLADYLTRETGRSFVVYVKSDFELFRQSMESGIDVAFTNPVFYASASSHHCVLAMASKGSSGKKFRGVIVTRDDSPISTVRDFLGKRVGYNGPTAGAAYLSQRLTQLEHSTDTKRDMTLIKPANNKQENTPLAVYAGDLDAGFVRESALQSVQAYIPSSRLKVLEETAWIPQWALYVSHSMPPEHAESIHSALIRLTSDDPALGALKIQAFKTALFAQGQWRTDISSGQCPHVQRAQRLGSDDQRARCPISGTPGMVEPRRAK